MNTELLKLCIRAVRLFDPTGCGGAQTPEEAARYIESFIARKEAGES